jgi:hypothetical protein
VRFAHRQCLWYTSDAAMRNLLFSNSLSKILATALCVSFLVPAIRADDQRRPSTQVAERSTSAVESDGAKSLPNRANADTPQLLTDKESADLQARSEDPGTKVAGGALSNLHLTYIVIALAAAVLVLVLK